MKTIRECINWCNMILKMYPSMNVEDKNFWYSIITYLEKLEVSNT